VPSVRSATLRADELPDVATVPELAAFERVDPRTLRADLDAGRVPGAFRRGRSWRIVTATYLAAIDAREPAMRARSAALLRLCAVRLRRRQGCHLPNALIATDLRSIRASIRCVGTTEVSYQAVEAVLRDYEGSATDKWVLVALARYADKDGLAYRVLGDWRRTPDSPAGPCSGRSRASGHGRHRGSGGRSRHGDHLSPRHERLWGRQGDVGKRSKGASE